MASFLSVGPSGLTKARVNGLTHRRLKASICPILWNQLSALRAVLGEHLKACLSSSWLSLQAHKSQ